MATEVPLKVLALIKLREGWKTTVYLDTRGFPTAGTGHLLSVAERTQYPVGATVPDDILTAWENNDTLSAYNAAIGQANVIGLNDQRLIDGLTPVNFQLGDSFYKHFPKMWSDLLAHNWSGAADEAQDSAWYAETKVRVEDFQAVLRSLG